MGTFVAIYILSRFSHFFRKFFLAKIAYSATSHIFCMYAQTITQPPCPGSRIYVFANTQTQIQIHQALSKSTQHRQSTQSARGPCPGSKIGVFVKIITLSSLSKHLAISN